MKTLFNNEINENYIDKIVTLSGWVSRVRNLGGLNFIDLRDRSGIIQLIVSPENKYYNLSQTLKSEYVIEVTGKVAQRVTANEKLATGKIEIIVEDLKVLNTSLEVPFQITEDVNASEETRLKYRYLDIRRPDISSKLVLRHKITMAIRKYLDSLNFLEIETPILCKSTPEGARDYLVPSRIFNGRFFALPQSPQIYKQLLMVGGVERYFQIAKCFRDEDLRADRQPEFTQVDVEMSFIDEEDVITLGENLVANVFKEVKGIDIKLPLLRMKYNDAIEFYGSDKPDLRFDMVIQNITNILANTECEFLKNTISNNGIVNAVVAKNLADKYSRKEIDKLTEYVKKYKASGLAYIKYNAEVTGSLVKSLSEKEITDIKNELNINENDIVFIISGNQKIVKTALGALRCKVASDNNLIDENDYKLLWVTDFPSFEWSEEESRFMACHHPFTAPKDEDIDKLLNDKANCYSKAYDIVINGYEAGGGSIRIHNGEVQEKMFEALELTKEDINNKFGFFVDALKYGTPPHGGFALGLDRLTMLLAKTDNIRDVIAFPKTASSSDLMSEAPNIVDEYQLNELGIKIGGKNE
ncbi:MAG: aspartate--tRNA ligase [Firmicutes bacterium]|nr:aspartate--tRNA ligase [Bacillota bacterium]